uniref:D-aspartate oxidase n=1 Tax=Neogobius melanostomus TaxID=47308 RepID=A0A8C6TM27_9GOBI
MNRVQVVVVGAGVIGFSTAVCVAESLPSCSVTLVAEKFSPDTTSDGAAGILFAAEFPDIPLQRQRRWFKDSFDHLLSIAQSAEAPRAGVMLSSGCQVFKEVPAVRRPFWSDLVIGFREMSEREMRRFPERTFGQAFTTLKCECASYLPWLHSRFLKAGGTVEQRRVSSLDELAGFDLIVNCSGLGSKTLANDTAVYSVRGQVLKVHAPWIQLELDEGDTVGILERCKKLEPSLENAKVLSQWVGLRPSRKNPRLEKDSVRVKGKKVPVVHNYGHSGWGVTLAWGCAVDALGLVKQSIREISPKAKL